jgi:phosphohistidine phosphatase
VEERLMRLYFLRHGAAAPRTSWSDADAERPLTRAGEATVVAVGRWLADLGVRVDLVLTSPYARAVGTAEIVAASLDTAERPAVEPRLAGGFGPSQLRAIVREHSGSRAIMLVGHEPDLSGVIAQLTGGGRVVMKKGGLARVDIDSADATRGTLVWLVPPGALPR